MRLFLYGCDSLFRNRHFFGEVRIGSLHDVRRYNGTRFRCTLLGLACSGFCN